MIELDKTSQELLSNSQSPDARALSVELKHAVADARYNLGEFAKMLEVALSAGEAARELVAANSGRDDWRRLRYESLFRIADAQASLRRFDEALENYRGAQLIAEVSAAKDFSSGARS